MKCIVALILAFGLQASLAAPTLTAAPSPPNAHVHGDILLTPEQEALFLGKAGVDRTGMTETWFRWRNNLVPVQLTNQNAVQSRIIWDALRDMETKICIRFVQRTTERDYVFITQ